MGEALQTELFFDQDLIRQPEVKEGAPTEHKRGTPKKQGTLKLAQLSLTGSDALEVQVDPLPEMEEDLVEVIAEMKATVTTKVNTDGYDPALAERFHAIISNCSQTLSPIKACTNFEVITYRLSYHWGYTKTTDYMVLIRVETVRDSEVDVQYWMPGVSIGPNEKEVGQLCIFHKTKDMLPDEFIAKHMFRSQEDFDALWYHLMERLNEHSKPFVKTKPSDMREGNGHASD